MVFVRKDLREGALITNSTPASSASSCNQQCLNASAAGLLQQGGHPLNCTMWRYCTSLQGCNNSSAGSKMDAGCQLQSYFSLTESFSEEPYLQLGAKGSNVTVAHTLYGMASMPSWRAFRPCHLTGFTKGPMM